MEVVADNRLTADDSAIDGKPLTQTVILHCFKQLNSLVSQVCMRLLTIEDEEVIVT